MIIKDWYIGGRKCSVSLVIRWWYRSLLVVSGRDGLGLYRVGVDLLLEPVVDGGIAQPQVLQCCKCINMLARGLRG